MITKLGTTEWHMNIIKRCSFRAKLIQEPFKVTIKVPSRMIRAYLR